MHIFFNYLLLTAFVAIQGVSRVVFKTNYGLNEDFPQDILVDISPAQW
jgi:hypothetical protein